MGAWKFQQTLVPFGSNSRTPTTGEPADDAPQFGASIAAFGDHLIITAPGEDWDARGNNRLRDSGAVFTYRRNVTTQPGLSRLPVVCRNFAVLPVGGLDTTYNTNDQTAITVAGDTLYPPQAVAKPPSSFDGPFNLIGLRFRAWATEPVTVSVNTSLSPGIVNRKSVHVLHTSAQQFEIWWTPEEVDGEPQWPEIDWESFWVHIYTLGGIVFLTAAEFIVQQVAEEQIISCLNACECACQSSIESPCQSGCESQVQDGFSLPPDQDTEPGLQRELQGLIEVNKCLANTYRHTESQRILDKHFKNQRPIHVLPVYCVTVYDLPELLPQAGDELTARVLGRLVDRTPRITDSLDIIPDCTQGCMVSCETFCEVGCEDNCQGVGACESSCQLRCESDCQTDCQVVCQAGCELSCQGDACQSFCQTTCEETCQADCESACQGGCEIAGCQLSCTAGCEGGCEFECQNACELDCQSKAEQACATSCQEFCEVCCEGGCEGGGCQSVCEGGCQQGCTVGCQDACQAGCQAACQGSCQANCEWNCQAACQGYGCETSCEGGCQYECQSSCEVTCEGASCQAACEVDGCQSCCECQCQTLGCETNCETSCTEGCQIACESACQAAGGCETGCEMTCELQTEACQDCCELCCEEYQEEGCNFESCETSVEEPPELCYHFRNCQTGEDLYSQDVYIWHMQVGDIVQRDDETCWEYVGENVACDEHEITKGFIISNGPYETCEECLNPNCTLLENCSSGEMVIFNRKFEGYNVGDIVKRNDDTCWIIREFGKPCSESPEDWIDGDEQVFESCFKCQGTCHALENLADQQVIVTHSDIGPFSYGTIIERDDGSCWRYLSDSMNCGDNAQAFVVAQVHPSEESCMGSDDDCDNCGSTSLPRNDGTVTVEIQPGLCSEPWGGVDNLHGATAVYQGEGTNQWLVSQLGRTLMLSCSNGNLRITLGLSFEAWSQPANPVPGQPGCYQASFFSSMFGLDPCSDGGATSSEYLITICVGTCGGGGD